jgi:hypothetical protein
MQGVPDKLEIYQRGQAMSRTKKDRRLTLPALPGDVPKKETGWSMMPFIQCGNTPSLSQLPMRARYRRGA